MSADIEHRLAAAMAIEPSSAPNWDAVENSLNRRHRRRVHVIRTVVGAITVAVMALGVGPLSGIADNESSVPPAGAPLVGPEDAYRTPAIIAALVTIVATFVVLSGRRHTEPHPLSDRRRFWPALVVIPLGYPIAQLLAYESRWGMLAQAAAIPCFPLLFWLLAERVAERRGRWISAATLWATIGATVVLGTTALIEPILNHTNRRYLWRLWPGRGGPEQEEILGSLPRRPGPSGRSPQSPPEN